MQTVKISEMPATLDADGEYLFEVGGPLRTVGQFNTLFAEGNWDGADIALYVTPDGTSANKVPAVGATLDADGFFNYLAKSRGVIVVMANAGGATDVKVWIA